MTRHLGLPPYWRLGFGHPTSGPRCGEPCAPNRPPTPRMWPDRAAMTGPGRLPCVRPSLAGGRALRICEGTWRGPCLRRLRTRTSPGRRRGRARAPAPGRRGRPPPGAWQDDLLWRGCVRNSRRAVRHHRPGRRRRATERPNLASVGPASHLGLGRRSELPRIKLQPTPP
eukprot:scaffold947_cov375-Prasinococcus_capsulatus_cf.AAC.13